MMTCMEGLDGRCRNPATHMIGPPDDRVLLCDRCVTFYVPEHFKITKINADHRYFYRKGRESVT